MSASPYPYTGRANPVDDADERQASSLLYELDRDDRQRERERQRGHARKWRAWDAEVRNLRERCGFCGQTAQKNVSLRVLADDFAGARSMGHLEIGFCAICLNLWRTYALTRNQPAMVLWKSIKRANLGAYYPAKGSPNHDRSLVGLSWAGWAFRLRTGGSDDPGDEGKPYSHLEGIKPPMIDFTPAQPEPALPRRLPVS